MKKFIKFIALAGLIGIAAVACKKHQEEIIEPEKPGTLTAPILSVSPSTVVVAPESEEIAITFSWTDVATKDLTPVYAFQITKKGDTEFSSGTAFECATPQKKFSNAELVALAGEIGASLDEGFTLIARVRVTAKDKKDVAAVLSNVVEASVSKEQYVIDNLYPIGNGTPYGWSQDKTEAMAKSGSTFTWTGHLYANADIKFLLQNDGNWWPGVVNKSDDPFKYEPVIGFSDADDKKFKVNKEGKYTITIDAANTNALKINFEFIDDDIQQLVVDHLYILGGATKTGWSLDDMEEFEKNGNIFTWEGSLTEGGEFRFPMQRDWWPCLMIAMDGETLVKGVSDDEKTGYAVDETAIYKIVCDIDNMKVAINKTGDIAPPEFPTLFMCGSATPYGWTTVMTDENQLKPVDSSNPNVLSWTGELKADGTFKFLTTSDWAPSYNRDATAEDYWTLVLRENYDQPDEQFQVAEDGIYTVVVDLDAMKVKCTKSEIVDTFDYTPSAAYNAAGNLWKAVDAAKAQRYFYSVNPDWAGQIYAGAGSECPYLEFKESTYKLTFDTATTGRWQNQFFVHPDEGHFIPLDPAKTYKFSVTAQSTQAFDAFFKVVAYDASKDNREGATIWEPAGDGIPSNVFFKANEPVVLENEITGVEAANINVFFDLGGNPAGTVVYIKDIILTEVGGGAAASITIDGDFSDWEGIEGVSNGSHGMFKAASDAENLYFYTWRTTEGRFGDLWGASKGYVYFAFDLDGDETNGVSLNSNGPYDYIGFIYCFGGTAESPVIEITAAGDCAPAGYTVANVTVKGVVDETGAKLEYSIPRADLPTIPNTPITITSWGNKDLAKVVLTCTL